MLERIRPMKNAKIYEFHLLKMFLETQSEEIKSFLINLHWIFQNENIFFIMKLKWSDNLSNSSETRARNIL